jgi:guanylate kinase
MSNGRLIVLAGPSCVGKSPLDKALARFHAELRRPLRAVVLATTWSWTCGETFKPSM